MKLREYQTKPILNELRTFSYQTKVGGQETTVNVELFPASMLDIANKIFLQKQGDLKVDEIMEDYKEGTYTAQMVADVIKEFHVQKWKHWLEMWTIDYNPIWNVDGTETHTIVMILWSSLQMVSIILLMVTSSHKQSHRQTMQ